MANQYVRVSGYTFTLNSFAEVDDVLQFEIPCTESYLDVRQAFKDNTGDIEIMYVDKVMQTYSGYASLKTIVDDLSTYFVTIGKEYNSDEALQIIVDSVPSVKEAKEFRASIEKMATSIPDEEAEKDIWAFPKWSYPVSYNVGDRVQYGSYLYKCVQAHTSQSDWTPDVASALFTRIGSPSEEWPEWIQPTGAHNAYAFGDKVSHNGKHWTSDINANVWEPGVAQWTEEVEPEPEPEPQPEPEPEPQDEWLEWVQPTGSQDVYSLGAKVSHNGKHWVSTVANNSWEPGVYGWEESTE